MKKIKPVSGMSDRARMIQAETRAEEAEARTAQAKRMRE